MIVEEWRMHSTLYRGRSFATFPLIVFAFSLGFSWIIQEYSTLTATSLGTGLQALGGFLGLAVGSVGFSSRDAMKNILGPMNLLIYSSRTLPVSDRKLLFDFIVKDILYYTGLFLIPVALGPLVVGGATLLEPSILMFGWFMVGLLVSLVIARTSLGLTSNGFLRYDRLKFLGPLADKSILDVSRSSGGLIKIIFSLAILTGFYWFAVIYFPVTRKLLTNPLLSFSVMLGTLNLSIYNWLNRFDSHEKYIYLPVTLKSLIKSKQTAYLFLALPLTLSIILISYAFYTSNLLISVLAGITTTIFTLLVGSRLTGLDPNRKLFNSGTFLKFVLANILVIVPLLMFSIFYRNAYRPQFIGACIFILLTSIYLLKRTKQG